MPGTYYPCTHYDGATRCPQEAILQVVQPDGQDCPGCRLCGRHYVEMATEYAIKLEETWTARPLEAQVEHQSAELRCVDAAEVGLCAHMSAWELAALAAGVRAAACEEGIIVDDLQETLVRWMDALGVQAEEED